MLSICLCDDDTRVLNCYYNKISDLLKKYNYEFEIETYKNAGSLIFELEDNVNKFKIIVIEIIMKNINGIEATKILRKYGYNGIIIFLTSSKYFALDSFSVDPLNYILKNDSDDKFNKIFLKAVDEVYKSSDKNIIISCKNKKKTINLDTIIYIESLNKKVILHKISGEIEEINFILKDIYEKVKEYGFIQCHKSYIVNIKYIQAFNKFECKLIKNVIIPIGRKYSKEFRRNFFKNELDYIII